MKIKIVDSMRMGFPTSARDGKTYECVKFGDRYRLMEKGVPQYLIKERWVQLGYAELVTEFNFMYGFSGCVP